MPGKFNRTAHSTFASLANDGRGFGDRIAFLEALFELERHREFDGFAQQYRFDDSDFGFGRPLQRPAFGPCRSFLTHFELFRERNFQHRELM